MKGAIGIPMLGNLPERDLRAALLKLCNCGLLTCTSRQPGEKASTYALAWLPLDDPDQYPAEVKHRHAENLRRLAGPVGLSDHAASH